jgi:hypothetical protein
VRDQLLSETLAAEIARHGQRTKQGGVVAKLQADNAQQSFAIAAPEEVPEPYLFFEKANRLTLAPLPQERTPFFPALGNAPEAGMNPPACESDSLSLGERAGVRASFSSH